eukprot:1901972-Alexandrium_andersonii.AAC.1
MLNSEKHVSKSNTVFTCFDGRRVENYLIPLNCSGTKTRAQLRCELFGAHVRVEHAVLFRGLLDETPAPPICLVAELDVPVPHRYPVLRKQQQSRARAVVQPGLPDSAARLGCAT